jgi:hypothetical protein
MVSRQYGSPFHRLLPGCPMKYSETTATLVVVVFFIS